MSETNPILKEALRLAPDLEITASMREAADANPDPKQTAARLQGRIEDWRKDFARDAEPSFDPEFIPYATVLSEIDLSKNYGSYAIGLSTQMAQLGRRDNFALGRHVGRQEVGPQLGLVELAYKELLGRVPDRTGFKHYQDRLDAGEPIFEIIRDIELSPEAQG